MSNRDFYEDTEVRATEAAGSEPEPLFELATPMTGELFRIDEALRESLEAEADHVAVPDGTADIVRWNFARNGTESITTMHWLGAGEYAERSTGAA